MKLSNGIWIAFCGIFVSCTEIYFTEPQPRGVKSTENGLEELVGEYINVEDSDTLRVSKDGVIWSEDENEEEALGNQFIVKKYKDRYFVNFLNEEKNLWQLFVVEKRDPNHIFVTNLTSVDEDNDQELIDKKFCRTVEDSGDSGQKYLILDPSRKQLLKLLKSPTFDQNKIDLNKIIPE